MKKIVLLILALMLTLTLAFVVSCNNESENPQVGSQSSTVNSDNEDSEIPKQGLWTDATYRKNTELGEGEKTFTLEVAAEDKAVTFTVKTNATTVGEALVALGLVEGENAQYGLYIKKVNGILADYNVDSTYWAFYINGSYAMSGVDSTDIVNGATYKLSREK